jgi:predicted transposase YbfD/YdcC
MSPIRYKTFEEEVDEIIREQEWKKLRTSGRIIEHFSNLTDPRVERTKRHLLIDVVVIGICAVICGSDTWTEMEEYGKAKYQWFKGFLELPNDIPSHDTFGRVFSRLSPEEFRECFLSWINAVNEITGGQVVAIDGKTLRRSFDKASDKAAIHMVSAWAEANRLVLGQVKVDDKSNEITAIPKLLNMLELSGCIVTIDAMGCQKGIAKLIIDKEADYILALKGNHGNLYEDVKFFFEDALKNGFGEFKYQYHETIDNDHGRIEIRRYWAISDISWLYEKEQWKGLKSIGMVESERIIGKETTTEKRYYISSLNGDAKQFAYGVRGHWGIENSVHWILDVAFREDESRIRKGNGAENFALLRHIALNLLKQEKSSKVGVKIKRNKAGWDNNYLLKVLFG